MQDCCIGLRPTLCTSPSHDNPWITMMHERLWQSGSSPDNHLGTQADGVEPLVRRHCEPPRLYRAEYCGQCDTYNTTNLSAAKGRMTSKHKGKAVAEHGGGGGTTKKTLTIAWAEDEMTVIVAVLSGSTGISSCASTG
ncbi:hypothetical protein W97_05988 [Coniosporium apollinis CBS 100218]|uniref:Uncharacterized protein n=1 Tax=Coniosporium apollinis (strain CBS 100218) TaxID=1168221 RepID=R7YXW0_CONA1|nr:uncharacterized protein W97_05988 [Coniosporium apollinis CBS 100218]EON66742.1 hypothetical protein W97_05988 [Coniosporium apollinis CBS 100218]